MNKELNIEIECQKKYDFLEEKKIEKIINDVLNYLEINSFEIGLRFVDKDYIHEINRDYRGKNSSTDIITFVYDSYEEAEVLGDMLVSVEDVEANANFFEVDFIEEVCRVLVHGVLHIYGFDHTDNDKYQPMMVFQEKILEKFKGEWLSVIKSTK